MRIKKLEIENINSLKGKWAIDFEDENYQNSGLFAITGPTGAGKSTILDGIALALYGQTPRLGIQSATSNEVMNKESGECSANVEFEANRKFYRATWSQRRARGKVDGNLQGSEQRLEEFDSKAETWTPIAQQVKEKAKLIRQVAGLSYEQFRRSVLLAQGDFAAFLKAEEKEKAEILEQVTGTEEYRTISSKTFERKAEESRKLEALEFRLNDKKLLSPEERQAKEDSFKQLNASLADLERLRKEIGEKLEWRKDLEDKNQHLQKLQREKETLDAQKEEMEQVKRTLEANQKAQKLDSTFNLLSQSRNDLADLQKKLPLVTSQIQTLIRSEDSAKASEVQAEEAVKRQKLANEQLREVLKKVAELDSQLKIQDSNLKEAIQRTKTASEAEKKAAINLKTGKDSLRVKEQEKLKLDNWLSAHKSAEVLHGKQDAMTALSTKAESLASLKKETSAELADAGEKVKETSQVLTQVSADVANAKKEIDQIKKAIAEKESQITDQLKGRDLDEYEEIIREQESKSRKLSEIKPILAGCFEAQKAMESKSEEIHTIEEQLKTNKDLLAQQKELVESLESQKQTLETLSGIEELTKKRALLVEGQECPLCGSKDHPFAEALPEGVLNAKKERNKVEKQLKEAESREEGLLKTVSSLEATIASTRAALDTEEARLQKFRNELCVQAKELGFSSECEPQVLENLVISAEQEASQERARCEKIKKNVRTLEKTKHTLQEKLANEETGIRGKEFQEVNLRRDLKHQEEQQRLLKEKSDKNGQDWTELISTATLDLKDGLSKPFGSETFIKELNQLQKAGKDFGLKSEELQKVVNALGVLQTEKKALLERHDNCLKELEAAEVNQKEKQAEFDKTKGQREDLFGTKDPAVEEKRAAGILEALEKNLADVQAKQRNIENELIQKRAEATGLEKSISENNEKLVREERKWKEELEYTGFMTEEKWKGSKLSDKEQSDRQQTIDAYGQSLFAKKNQISQLQKEVNEKTLQNKTELTLWELEEQKANNEKSIGERNKEIGGVKEELDRDDKIRNESKALQAEIEKQRKVFEKWERLNNLIGQKDGAKYQKYVQSLTLETLITKTNKVLSQLSTRYLLIKNQVASLDLDVVDNEMDELVRATSNLSGGETFIVSLALALGLSELTSNKIRIDSLFLDEGFGSLDEESLDKALTALGNLNTFNKESGHQKLIGVISHVGQIHERIPVQINVTPQQGGSSILKGPGVQKLV